MEKFFGVSLLAMALAAGALAEAPQPARIAVGTAGLDLSTPRGMEKLADRFVFKMKAICGKAKDANLSHVMLGKGKEERQKCIADLQVESNDSQIVWAFNRAKEKIV